MTDLVRTLYRKFLKRTRGVVDSWENGKCSGWAVDAKMPGGTARVHLMLDGKVLKTVTANQSRKDLLTSGFASTEHGFSFELPDEIFLRPESHCQVVFVSDSKPLLNGSFVYKKGMRLPPSLLPLYSSDDISSLIDESRVTGAEMVCHVRGEIDAQAEKCILYAINADQPFLFVEKVCREFRDLGYQIVIINSRPDAERHDEAYAGFSDVRIYKTDWGRDFASWITGYHHLAEIIARMHHVVFINDSIIGPMSAIAGMMEKFHAANVDFWALTDSYDQTYHFQSSFFVLSAKALASRAWRLFLANYAFPNDKTNVIAQGELALSSIMIGEDVNCDVMCPYHEVAAKWMATTFSRNAFIYGIDNAFHTASRTRLRYAEHCTLWYSDTMDAVLRRHPRNAQHTFWDTLLVDYTYPFVKKELYVFNPENVPNLSLVTSFAVPEYRTSAEDIFLDFTRRTGEGRTAPPLRLAVTTDDGYSQVN